MCANVMVKRPWAKHTACKELHQTTHYAELLAWKRAGRAQMWRCASVSWAWQGYPQKTKTLKRNTQPTAEAATRNKRAISPDISAFICKCNPRVVQKQH